MRVFVIPVTRTKWALHCQPLNTTPTRLTRWAQTAAEKWSTWNKYSRDTWRGKVYQYGERLMDRIDFKEYFLKGIPSKGETGAVVMTKVDVLLPKIIGREEAIKGLQKLTSNRIPYHQKWLWRSCYLLPLTALFSIVPIIPNFPMFYNIFRIYSHYKARQGAIHLSHLLENESSFDVVFDSGFEKWYGSYDGTRQDINTCTDDASTNSTNLLDNTERLSPADSGYMAMGGRDFDSSSSSLENGVPLLEIHPLISDADVAEMASYFDNPSFEPAIRHARHQILDNLRKEI